MSTKVLMGHNSRGKEVIQLLEMLGGKNTIGFKNTFVGFYYWINEYSEITTSDMPPANSMVYLLEDFEKEYPYRVGDCVRYYPHKVSIIKSMFISYDGDVKYELKGVDDSFFQAHQLEYVGRAEYCERKENNKNMTNIAIKGHETRGEEIIKLLQMLGGNNTFMYYGDDDEDYYYIDNNDEINVVFGSKECINDYTTFTLEEFENKYPYKVGDKVTTEHYKDVWEIIELLWSKNLNIIHYGISNGKSKELVRVEEIKPYKEEKTFPPYMDYDIKATKEQETIEEPKELLIGFTKDDEGNWILNTHKDYEIKEINGKFKLIKKKPVYPKTYVDCCDVLGILDNRGLGFINYLSECENILMSRFIQLKRCRDAYWKIAGEEMGLDKPWEPDWCNENKLKYCIECSFGTIDKTVSIVNGCFLAFPTAEMRDTFYVNFKDLINQCKELL